MEFIKQAWLSHGRAIAVTIAMFIIFETGFLYYDARNWWVPFSVALAVLIGFVFSRFARTAIKIAVSVIIAIVVTALATLAGSSFAMGSASGVIWGISMLASYLIVMVVSLFAISTYSRWTVSAIALVIGFIASYTFMPLGLGYSSIAGAGVTILVYLLTVIAIPSITRKGKKSPSISSDASKLTKLLNGKLLTAKLRKHRIVLRVDDDKKLTIFIPLMLDDRINQDSKGRLSYHHRNLYGFFYYWTVKALRIFNAPAFVIFVDVNDVNDSTSTEGRILTLSSPDSDSPYYAGLMSLHGSQAKFNARLDSMLDKVNGLQALDDKKMKSLVSRYSA